MVESLTEEQITEFKGAFMPFNIERDDTCITEKDLATLMDSLGHKFTEDDLREHLGGSDAEFDIDIPCFL